MFPALSSMSHRALGLCKSLLTLSYFLSSSLVLAQEHHTAAVPTNKVVDPLVQQGQKAYVQACGFCHGEDASGNRAPDLIRSSLVNHDKEGELISAIIRNGRADKGMPAFPPSSLKDDQVTAIVAFLHARATEAKSSAHVANDYPVEKLLTGNAAEGKTYFNGVGQCATCHSPDKDLKGVATRIQPVNLQQRFLYPENHNAETRTATVVLPNGDRVSGKVVHIDNYSVTLKDGEGWTRSWDREGLQVEVNDPLAAHRELLAKYTDADVHNLFAYLETLK